MVNGATNKAITRVKRPATINSCSANELQVFVTSHLLLQVALPRARSSAICGLRAIRRRSAAMARTE
jgi:hypothetical protein